MDPKIKQNEGTDPKRTNKQVQISFLNGPDLKNEGKDPKMKQNKQAACKPILMTPLPLF